ncbi:MAG: hypothetical protein FWE56_03750 [Candidatus Bathyarchaeota archaeon]|nr:hypothetical protein [Candidatus Termiticorpusculum sp.]
MARQKIVYCKRRGGNECAKVPVSKCPTSCSLYFPDPYPTPKAESDPANRVRVNAVLKRRAKMKNKSEKTMSKSKKVTKKEKWGKIGAPNSSKRKAWLKSLRDKRGKKK